MLHIASNPSLKGLSVLSPKIVYSTHTGKDITLDLLMPQIPEDACEKRYPLIVFIQGSAWHFPDTNYEIPQLARFADDGFVVASVTHRTVSYTHLDVYKRQQQTSRFRNQRFSSGAGLQM